MISFISRLQIYPAITCKLFLAKMSKDTVKMDLDSLLVNHLGQFCKFQLKVISLLTFSLIFMGYQYSAYIFTTARISSRCYIPECDGTNPQFTPSWILNAVPGSSIDAVEICSRYDVNISMITNETNSCPASMFDNSITKSCDKGLVYENEKTIVYDFDLGCDEWQRSLVGSIKNTGTFLGTLMMGIMADRVGRKTVMIFNIFCAGCLGTIRYWSNTYAVFVSLDLAESILAAGCYQCIYVLFIETVGPDYRDIAGTSILALKGSGNWFLSLFAWLTPNWRILTLVLYVPQIFIITYNWLLPESLRWLMSKGRYEEATIIFQKIAKTNGKNISEDIIKHFKEQVADNEKKIELIKKDKEKRLIQLVLREKELLKRCLVTPIWWITTTFIYQGLAINAINLFGNKYLNYFVVSLVDLPGFITSPILTKYFGRRSVLVTGFCVCAVCQITNILISSEAVALSLSIYLFGKFSIAIVSSVLYVYTAELYPTQYRQSLFGYTSTIGRLGSIFAPLTPSLSVKIWSDLPYALFAGFALLSASLMFVTPETKGKKLPDTIDDIIEKSHTTS